MTDPHEQSYQDYVDYMISVMQAYKEGKQIEVTDDRRTGVKKYLPVSEPTWNWYDCHYRVMKDKDPYEGKYPMFRVYKYSNNNIFLAIAMTETKRLVMESCYDNHTMVQDWTPYD